MRSLALVACVEQDSAAEEEEEAKVQQQQPSSVLLRHWTGVAAALVGLSLAALCLAPLFGYPVIGVELADNHLSGHLDRQSFLGKVSVNSGKIISMDSDHIDCDRYPYFRLVEVMHSNLGGRGPDSGEEGIIYQVRNTQNDELMELRLNAKSSYEPELLKLNGCAGLKELRGAECGGRFGAFNLKAGTSANLTLSFFDSTTKQPMSVKHVAITWFDIDENLAHTNTESISMRGFSKYMLQDPSNVSTQEREGGASWSSTSYGDGDNNPIGPEGLTAAQKELSVSVYYDGVSSMDMTMVAGAAGRDGHGREIKAMGRFFTFALMPCLPCARTLLPALKWEAPEEALEARGAFYKWNKDVGDPVEPGDVIAMTRAGNNIQEIRTPPDFLGGFLVARQPFHMGDVMERRMEAQPIAVLSPRAAASILCAGASCQELPALRVGDGQVGVQATGIFLAWRVRKGQQVQEGDPVAVANATGSGPAVEILAPYPGTVTELQPFKRGDVMEDRMAEQPIAVITSLGTLPVARGDAPVLVPNLPASTLRFHAVEADVGDAVRKGDIVATLMDADENLVEVSAPIDGYVKSVQLLTQGAFVQDVLADGRLAVIQEERQRLIPLSREDRLVPVEADEKGLFEKYLVEEGEEVTVGRPIALVTAPSAAGAPPRRRLLLAHVTGAVWARQGLSKGDKLEEVMQSRDRCVATILPDAGPTARDPVFTVLAPNNFPGLTQFVEWLVGEGADVGMGDNIARAKLRNGVLTTLKAPASGRVLRVLKELNVGEELQGAGDDITIVTPSTDPIRVTMRLANLPAGSRFNKWHAEVGDQLQPGDKLATVILPSGEVTEVAVYRTGWVAEVAVVNPGDFVEGNQELGELVCPAGVPGSSYYPVDTALLPEGTVFEEWLATAGAQVREGDGIARVKLVDGQVMTLTAGHDGVVAELAPVYKGDRLADALPWRVHAIATVIVDPFAAGVTMLEAGQRVPSVSTSVSVVPGDLLVQWHRSVGDNISEGDPLATVMRRGVPVEVGSPRRGTVVRKAPVDDGDPITESTSSPFAVIEDHQLRYAVHVQGAAAVQGDEFVAWVAQVDDFVKEGDVICVLRRNGEVTRIKAGTTGYVIFEETLRPGDKVKRGQDNPLFLVDPTVPPAKEMGASTQPGNKLLRWEKSIGDRVKKGSTVATVLQDGKEVPIRAPQDGAVSFEEQVRIGDVIPKERSSPLLSLTNLSPLPDKSHGVSTSPEDVFVAWVKFVGDSVRAGDVVARVQRDSRVVQLKSPVAGRVAFEQDTKPNLTIGLPMHSPIFMVESPDPFGSTSAGQDAEPGDEFVEWTYSNGDAVKRGAVVAVVRREGELLPIQAPRSGWVTRTAPIRSGETITREGSHPLFSVDDGLFKPPPSGIGQSAAPGDRLLRWHKTMGSEVMKGDLIATVDRDSAEVPLYAPCNGKMSFVQKLVAGDNFTEENSTPLFVVTPLEASLPRGTAVNARPGDEFVGWRRGLLERVGRREAVAVLRRHGEVLELVAPIAGHVSFQQDWVPGQMIDSVNNSPAFLVDPRAYGPTGPGTAVLAPDPSKLGFAWVRFKSWAISPGDRVQPGDVVAVVELVPPGVQRRLTALAAPKEIQVLSPVSGCVGDVMNLHEGDKLEDRYASRKMASIGVCPLPRSLWLLLLLFLVACWLCSCYVISRKRRLQEHYSTMKQLSDTTLIASTSKPSFEAPPRPIVTITFDFEDLEGGIHSYNFTHRPLGIVYEKGVSPVRVQRCKFNSYARWMGVQDGWTIRKVSGTDVSNKSVHEVEELTKEYLRGKPIWPLRLDFREHLPRGSSKAPREGDHSQRSVSFLVGTQPIGIEFGPRFPIIVSKVFPDTYASDHGIRERWKLVGIGYNDTNAEPLLALEDRGDLDYRGFMQKFRDGVSLLDIREDNAQILTQTQVRRWENNLGEETTAFTGHHRASDNNQRHGGAVY